MPSIRAGLGDRIDDATRMQAVAGGQSAGFDAKFGQCIGKGKRHVYVGKAVVVVSAIEQVVGGVPSATGDGNGL